jgi:hypothetical protein
MTNAAEALKSRSLCKAKVMAFRQCPRRLWLEVHRPELRLRSTAAKSRFEAGYGVGEVARRLYDPKSTGVLIDAQAEGCAQALDRSTALLASSQPIFEAGFAAGGVIAFANVMLPIKRRGGPGWRMVEVKSSTSVKEYYREDVAVQAYAARQAGVKLESISVAHVDSGWVYPGGGDYQGLLTEVDLTEEAFARTNEVSEWVGQAQAVAKLRAEPVRATGAHCQTPFECGFIGHCAATEPQAEFPVAWLPRVQTKALKAHIAQPGVTDMRHVPDELLNASQQRVKQQTLSGQAWFDARGAARALREHKAPTLYFLDFETIQFAVPRWAGTRPYEQLPFQFSLHRLLPEGSLEHDSFLDLSGADPTAAFTQALIKACGSEGPVFVYNASFELARMKELGVRFPRKRAALGRLADRVVDLLPIVEAHYYHPLQEGSWSIKKVLPAMVPDLRYDQLDGVQDGGAAMDAYFEATSPTTIAERKGEIERQLLAYCGLDTYAMVRLWQVLAGRNKMRL